MNLIDLYLTYFEWATQLDLTSDKLTIFEFGILIILILAVIINIATFIAGITELYSRHSEQRKFGAKLCLVSLTLYGFWLPFVVLYTLPFILIFGVSFLLVKITQELL